MIMHNGKPIITNTSILMLRWKYQRHIWQQVERMSIKIAVIGMGYVGIPIAALLADVEGFSVVGVQRRSARSGWKIDQLNEGRSPLSKDEPGLSELVSKVWKKGTFRVTDDFSACADADYVLIDVQTPIKQDRTPDYDSLKKACQEVGRHIKRGATVILESTVAPGTTDNFVKPILERESGMKAGEGFFLAFGYERVMPGRLIKNIVDLPKVVGGVDEESSKKAVELYGRIVKAEIHVTDTLTAETAKVVENAYRDVNIAFANEVALICESLGVDAFEVQKLVNTLPNDPTKPETNPIRHMLFPGSGVGGGCLPKDSWLLIYGANKYGKKLVDSRIIVNGRRINDSMPIHMADLVEETLHEHGKTIKGIKIAILGASYLENSSDTRNTPSAVLYDELVRRGARPILHDPIVQEFDRSFTVDLNEALKDATAAVLMTKHKEYQMMNYKSFKEKMLTPILIDGRDAYNEKEVGKAGLMYKGVGKGRKP
jgi:UDP-N-acetyl-D-mannosaminuronic acid dehydrogenase